MTYRTECIVAFRAKIAEDEARLAAGDFAPADPDLAALLGADAESERTGCVERLVTYRRELARAEASTDAEWGESWTHA